MPATRQSGTYALLVHRGAAVLLCGVLLWGAASCTSSSESRPKTPLPTRSAESDGATPEATRGLRPALAHLLTVIHQLGYQTFPDELQKAGQFYPGLRPVLVAKPRYLGNGFRCSNVLFFSHGRYVGRDSASCHLDPEIDWANSREVSIVYPRWAKHDPMCCPTPNPKRVIFRLVDGRVKSIRR